MIFTTRNWTGAAIVYGLFEGTFQDERALYTHLLSGPMFTTDPGTYLRLGAIYKF